MKPRNISPVPQQAPGRKVGTIADTVTQRRSLAIPACAVAWLGTVMTIAIALAVYLSTLAPTITWRRHGSDGGDLVTAALNLGVPHPTGYPWYTLLAHLFTALPGAEPARKVALLSALAAALAVGLVFWTGRRSLVSAQNGRGAALVGAWVAAGGLAFGEMLWSQATIAGTYALNALLVAATIALLAGPSWRLKPYALAVLLGVGLAHHVTIVLLLPALWPYARNIRGWLSARRLAALLLCLLPGLLTYLYIPLRARTYPVPNWGGAEGLSGLAWLVSAKAYHGYFGTVPAAQVVQRLSAWAGIWLQNVGIVGLALALLGLQSQLDSDRRSAWFGLTYVAATSFWALSYSTVDSFLYMLPALIPVCLWMGRGVLVVWRWTAGVLRNAPWSKLRVAVLALAALLPMVSLTANWRSLDISRDREALDYATGILSRAAPGAVLLSNGDLQTFPLWYVRYGLGMRPDVTVVDRNLLAFDWYCRDLALRDPRLGALVSASDALEAAEVIVQGAWGVRPVQLTYEDGDLLRQAEWRADGSLLTLTQPR
jgi:hypothetical protein